MLENIHMDFVIQIRTGFAAPISRMFKSGFLFFFFSPSNCWVTESTFPPFVIDLLEKGGCPLFWREGDISERWAFKCQITKKKKNLHPEIFFLFCKKCLFLLRTVKIQKVTEKNMVVLKKIEIKESFAAMRDMRFFYVRFFKLHSIPLTSGCDISQRGEPWREERKKSPWDSSQTFTDIHVGRLRPRWTRHTWRDKIVPIHQSKGEHQLREQLEASHVQLSSNFNRK